MSNVVYEIDIYDSANQGAPVPGLAPAFRLFKRLSDNTDVTPQPAITEIGFGKYKFSYDAATNGEVTWQVDAGNVLVIGTDRYINGQCLLDNTADGLVAIASAAWNALVGTLQAGTVGSIGRLLSQFSFSTKNNFVRVSPAGYEDGQDPVALMRVAPVATSPAPTVGTWDEVMSVMRGLAVGKQVEDVTVGIMTVYNPDGLTPLYRLTYSPNLSTPTSRTSDRI